MSYNARNDEIRDNITRMRREWEAQRGALATVRPPPHRARRPGGPTQPQPGPDKPGI
jgi:hypothetical protein